MICCNQLLLVSKKVIGRFKLQLITTYLIKFVVKIYIVNVVALL